MNKKRHKRESKRLKETRQARTNKKEFDRNRFWEMIKRVSLKNDTNYHIQLQVFQLELRQLSEEEIVTIDNTICSIFKENVSSEIIAASEIIFGEKSAIYCLLSICLFQGEVFFKQSCINPEFIANKEIESINSLSLLDKTNEEYYNKTNNLNPLLHEEALEHKIEFIETKEYQNRFPLLTRKFSSPSN
ncbi:MAG: hypothetical protein ACPGTP_02105 [Bacteroidia bacterium]